MDIIEKAIMKEMKEVFDEDGGGFGVAEVHSVGVHCGEEAGTEEEQTNVICSTS